MFSGGGVQVAFVVISNTTGYLHNTRALLAEEA